MRLVYDNLIYSLQDVGGISTYWYELTQRFLREKGIDLRFYETGKKNSNLLRLKLPLSGEQVLKSRRTGVLLERFSRLPAIQEQNVFHSSYFRVPLKTSKTRVVTTVHDFTYDFYYNGPRVWLHNLVKRRAINESHVIIAVSTHTKNDLLNLYPHINPSTVKVIYHGASTDFKIQTTKQEYKDAPFFLFVGSRESYKNFDFAVKLAAAYKDFNLLIVGNPLSKQEQQMLVQRLGNRYQIYTGLNNTELNNLYNAAFCLLYPSSYEGFGLPLLEAMQAGCPFIALKSSAVPEVAGKAGILLNELSIEEALNAVEIIISNKQSIVEKGLSQSGKFSWDLCFTETYNVYKSLT